MTEQKYMLLSIRPKYVEEIEQGVKKFEFRKLLPNFEDKHIHKTVLVYCSKPKMMIIGSFIVGHQLHNDFNNLMVEIGADKAYKKRIGSYFTNHNSCHALEIVNFKRYKTPLTLTYLRKEFPPFTPGQSYRFISSEIINRIIKLNDYL